MLWWPFAMFGWFYLPSIGPHSSLANVFISYLTRYTILVYIIMKKMALASSLFCAWCAFFFFLFFFLLILFVCFYSPWTLKTLFVPLFCFTEADLKWPVYISTCSVMQLFTFDFINWRFQFTVHMVILNCGTQFVFFIAIITERQPYLCVDWYFGSFFPFLTLQKRL